LSLNKNDTADAAQNSGVMLLKNDASTCGDGHSVFKRYPDAVPGLRLEPLPTCFFPYQFECGFLPIRLFFGAARDERKDITVKTSEVEFSWYPNAAFGLSDVFL